MKRFAIWTGLLSLPILLSLSGCGGSETEQKYTNADGSPAGKVYVNDITGLNGATPTPGPASPGGAPTFGTQSGMGLATGDALHSGGQGSGLMGFNGTGSMGTSNAITDKHDPGEPAPSAKDPVLPKQ